MSRPVATQGRIVLYVLNAQNAEAINRRRVSQKTIANKGEGEDGSWPIGAQVHVGNRVSPGDVFPAMVVKVWNADLVNLKVELDGTDSLWVTSAPCSDEPMQGSYHWMDYQKQQAARS